MKLFVVLLLVAMVFYNVDASHKKHKTNMKSQDIDELGDDSNSWPSPSIINNFDVPEEFHHHDGDDQEYNENDSGHRHHSRRS